MAMVKGFDGESENFVLQLRHPKESNVKGRPRVLISQIVENLRTALDYMIFQLSVLNEPHLKERLSGQRWSARSFATRATLSLPRPSSGTPRVCGSECRNGLGLDVSGKLTPVLYGLMK